MSGGSMDYLFRKVENATFRTHTPQRRAFLKHLGLVARALKAIEWNDSCDGTGGWEYTEESVINDCLNPSDVLAQATKDAERALDDLRTALAQANGGTR